METAFDLVFTLIILVVLYPAFHTMARTYLKFRGARVVTCPETQQPATIKVNATRAALMLLVGTQSLRLKDCSRWPDRRQCGQQCARQLGEASEPGVVI